MTSRHQPERRSGGPHVQIAARLDHEAVLWAGVGGELDLATGSIVRERLRKYDGRAKRVVYQLSDLSFLDASGLEFLLCAVDGVEATAITVREPSRQARRLLELVGLESMIEASVEGNRDRSR